MYGLHLIAGILLLAAGGELLVRNSTKLAESLHLPRLLVGLTIVAFGTSSPELFVSVNAAITDSADIAFSNVVGSNIFNVLFILGVSALILPLTVSETMIRRDVSIMVVLSLLLVLLASVLHLHRWTGACLIFGLICYIWTCYRRTPNTKPHNRPDTTQTNGRYQTLVHRSLCILLILGSLALLGYGAQLFVGGTRALAKALGMSDLIVGLTVVSVGTSLPEAATSVIASFRGEKDIAVGNIIGSNIFNIFGVLGITLIFSPKALVLPVSMLAFDLPVMLLSSVLCLPIFLTGRTISRKEGAFFLILYIAYVGFLVWRSTGFLS